MSEAIWKDGQEAVVLWRPEINLAVHTTLELPAPIELDAVDSGRGSCPEDCRACSGEVCEKCGAGAWRHPDCDGVLCDHDVIERHEKPA